MTRQITPHKGGRNIKKSTDVTDETNKRLIELAQQGISLGDLIEWAVAQKENEMNATKALRLIAQKEVASRVTYGDPANVETITDYLDREANRGEGLEYETSAATGGVVVHTFYPTTEQIRAAVEWALSQPVDIDLAL